MDPLVALTKSLASSDFEVSKSSPNDPNKPHPRYSQYKNRNRQSDQGKLVVSYVYVGEKLVVLDMGLHLNPRGYICCTVNYVLTFIF